MDRWEQEQEEIIKREHDLQRHAQSLTDEQIRKNIELNWMEVIDENGNKHYEPLFDNAFRFDSIASKPKKESFFKGRILFIICVLLVVPYALLFYVSFFYYLIMDIFFI